MIFSPERPKFLPLFKECLEYAAASPLKQSTYIIKEEPIDCQVVATRPKLVLSDGFHKVLCEITEEAVIGMKKEFSAIKVKELDKKFITLFEYAPHTYISNDGTVNPILHIYKYSVIAPDKQKENRICGSPTELASNENIKSRSALASNKHLRRFMSTFEDVEKLPPLESILLRGKSSPISGRVIKFDQHKMNDDKVVGREILDYAKLDAEEERLGQEASRRNIEEKKESKRLKEQGRRIAAQRREKPLSLGKELLSYLDKKRTRQEKDQKHKIPSFIKEGVAELIAKEGNIGKPSGPSSLRSASKVSVSKSINSKRETVSKQRQNASEVKFTAKGFKGFLNWKASTNAVNHDETNVASVLKASKAGPIRVEFAAPSRPTKRAFDGWVSEPTPTKKRGMPEGNGSVRKSVKKSKYQQVHYFY